MGMCRYGSVQAEDRLLLGLVLVQPFERELKVRSTVRSVPRQGRGRGQPGPLHAQLQVNAGATPVDDRRVTQVLDAKALDTGPDPGRLEGRGEVPQPPAPVQKYCTPPRPRRRSLDEHAFLFIEHRALLGPLRTAF